MRRKGILRLFHLWLCLGLLTALAFVTDFKVYAKKSDTGRVLFISSYSYAWDTVQMQIDGIVDGLGESVDIDYEFMDTKRVNTEESRRLFFENLQYRLSMVEPYDAVILGDDAALLFAMEYRDTLFADIPIIFEGVNDENLAREAVKDPLITGVLEKLSLPENIELGLDLIPDATKVVAILDDSLTGQAERERFYRYEEAYPQLTFTEINVSQLSSEQLIKELSAVSKDSILIYVVMTEDADGKLYNSREAVETILRCVKVPCFRMVEAGIGEGLLGGNVVSMYLSGEIAGQMTKDVIDGMDISRMGLVEDGPNIYCVDELVMKKYKLDMGHLPKDTKVINHQPTFMERNHEAQTDSGN